MKRALIMICVALVLATMLPLAALAAQVQEYPQTAQAVVQETNLERARRGLSSLSVSAELTAAARVRAREIVKKFSHTRPDGSKWLTVSSKAKGENLAKGQQTVNKVMAAWMSSNGHRQNILRASYKTIGVSACKLGNIWYWVQLFGW